jgi:L-arabinose transport system ATP-binding protein
MHHLRFDNVSKSFPGVRALSAVSFSAEGGSVLALLGENGAGKSTLLKILSGVYRADSGQVVVDNQPVDFRSTADAINAGVAVIYQELQLVPELSVAENLYLGHLPNNGGVVKKRQLLQKSREQLIGMGEQIDPRAKVGSLPIAQRQMVEIAKALSRNSRVIAFDEPTSSLSDREVDRLFAIIRQLRNQGRVILYVSHRMEEIYRICDAATVLRDGKRVESFPKLAETTPGTLVNRMVGRSIDDVFHYSPRPHGERALEIRDVTGPGVNAPVSLTVNRGEILGIFGLVGAGRSELMKLIIGATKRSSGEIRVHGEPTKIHSPSQAIKAGIVFAPEDRKKEGIIPIRSVMENVNLSSRRHFSHLGFVINGRKEREHASKYAKQLGVKTPSLSQLIVNLSGGNQQKVILARWLGEKIHAILLDEPTRGIDVGAKSEIYSIIYELAKSGVGVIVVSSELPEILGISDRIAVMRQGKIVAEFSRDQATAEKVLQEALPVAETSSSQTKQQEIVV